LKVTEPDAYLQTEIPYSLACSIKSNDAHS